MMKIFLSIVLLSVYLNAFFDATTRYVNGDYDKNLKVIWMYSKADNTSDGLQSKFAKALNKTLKKLQNDFENVSSTQLKEYTSIVSVMEDSSIYTNKEKLFDADMLGLLDANLDTQFVVLLKLEKVSKNHYRLYGIKLFKDGDESIVSTYEVNKNLQEVSIESLEDMTYFFVKSSIDDYKGVNRSASQPIITYADKEQTKLQIQIFKNQIVKILTTNIQSQDFELASSLKLLSSDEVNQQTAQEYCETIGMMLVNKNFVMETLESEYYYEELFEKFSFKDGWIVYKRAPYTDIKDKDIRCIEAGDSVATISITEYENNEIGIRYRLNADALIHTKKLLAVDIKDAEAFDGSDTIYTAIIDESGYLSVWENSESIIKTDTGIKDARGLQLSDDMSTVTIDTYDRKIVLTIADSSQSPENKNLSSSGYYVIQELNDSNKTVAIYANNTITIDGTTTQLPYWPRAVAIYNQEVIIGDGSSVKTYQIDDVNMLVMQNVVEHNDFSGDVNKILYFRGGEYFVVATTKSELVFYKRGEPNAIKNMSNFGYSINDIAISDDNKYLIAANGDETAYIFDLEVIINSTVSDKETK